MGGRVGRCFFIPPFLFEASKKNILLFSIPIHFSVRYFYKKENLRSTNYANPLLIQYYSLFSHFKSPKRKTLIISHLIFITITTQLTNKKSNPPHQKNTHTKKKKNNRPPTHRPLSLVIELLERRCNTGEALTAAPAAGDGVRRAYLEPRRHRL